MMGRRTPGISALRLGVGGARCGALVRTAVRRGCVRRTTLSSHGPASRVSERSQTRSLSSGGWRSYGGT